MQETVQSLHLPRVGLTHGDLNGVGYELVIKAFDDARMLGMMTPVLYGQSKAFSYYKKNFGLDSFNYSLTRDARQAWGQKFNIVNIVDKELKIDPGMVTEVSTEMDIMSMKRASEDLRVGYLDAVVMAHRIDSSSNTFLMAYSTIILLSSSLIDRLSKRFNFSMACSSPSSCLHTKWKRNCRVASFSNMTSA